MEIGKNYVGELEGALPREGPSQGHAKHMPAYYNVIWVICLTTS